MSNTGLHIHDIQAIQAVFQQHPEIETVILYGSRAKGNYKPASDIDLTLIGEGVSLSILHEIENELDDLLLPYKFDVSIFHQISHSDLLEHIRRVGKVFYEAVKV